jgi:hypothetical protein
MVRSSKYGRVIGMGMIPYGAKIGIWLGNWEDRPLASSFETRHCRLRDNPGLVTGPGPELTDDAPARQYRVDIVIN